MKRRILLRRWCRSKRINCANTLTMSRCLPVLELKNKSKPPTNVKYVCQAAVRLWLTKLKPWYQSILTHQKPPKARMSQKRRLIPIWKRQMKSPVNYACVIWVVWLLLTLLTWQPMTTKNKWKIVSKKPPKTTARVSNSLKFHVLDYWKWVVNACVRHLKKRQVTSARVVTVPVWFVTCVHLLCQSCVKSNNGRYKSVMAKYKPKCQPISRHFYSTKNVKRSSVLSKKVARALLSCRMHILNPPSLISLITVMGLRHRAMSVSPKANNKNIKTVATILATGTPMTMKSAV